MTNSSPLTPRAVVLAGYEGDMQVIDSASTSEDPRCRVAALGAKVRQECLSLDDLSIALADSNDLVQLRALDLIAHGQPTGRTPDEIIAALFAFTPNSPPVEEALAFTFGELGEGDDAIIEWLSVQVTRHSDALVREASVAALGALHTGLDIILGALSDKATVRRRAVIALAPFDGPEVEAALRHALDDRDWQVRQAAEDLLAP